jgi:spore germination protein YaaH
MTRRPIIGVGAVVLAVTVVLAVLTLGAGGSRPAGSGAPGATGASGSGEQAGPIGGPATPGATVVPKPGHELFGYVPYWEMNAGITDHLAKTPLTTLGLFSVTNKRDGTIDTSQQGYKKIAGALGKQMIREAHDRHVAVQLTFTSFGDARNQRLFGPNTMATQDAVIAGLVKMAGDTGVDGISVDVERLDPTLVPAYGDFVGRLRDAVRKANAKGQVSVSTSADQTGAAMAAAATAAGADRVFLMGYDYHYGQSDVGASAPMARRDGQSQDLPWSLDLYASMGVPVEKTVLGLPLYGVRWRVAGPEIGAQRLGDGAIWVPADNPKFLASPPAPPQFDPLEVVEFYAVAPTVSPVPGDSRATAGWQAIYVDSPRTLAPKLSLADQRGLAGAGFWAIGYERGLDGYQQLMHDFVAGKLQ